MAESDSLSNFDFGKMSKPGKFLKFEAGKPVTVRILTKDPVIQEKEFPNGMSTKLCFIVWNFTDELAQILAVSPKMAKTFQNIGTDEDFGSNLQKCDIKISPEGEMLDRVYDVNVIRHSGNEKPITQAIIDAAKEIDLEKDIQDNKGRLSSWEAPKAASGYEKAKAVAKEIKAGAEEAFPDEPINLDDIPF